MVCEWNCLLYTSSLAEAVELARANSRRGLLICGGEAIALEAADLLAEK